MAYIFLKSADRHEHRNNPRWWAISEDRIETLDVSDSYDQFGQRISSSDAGDYLEILSQAAADVANQAYNEDVEPGDEGFKVAFEVGENVNAYDQCAVFDAIIESDLQDGVDYNLKCTQFDGFNYWDGSNWKTIVTNAPDGNETHEIEDDKGIIARLNEALENEEFVKEGFGTKTFRYKDAEITYSQFSSAWEYAEITLDNDFEEI